MPILKVFIVVLKRDIILKLQKLYSAIVVVTLVVRILALFPVLIIRQNTMALVKDQLRKRAIGTWALDRTIKSYSILNGSALKGNL